MPRGPSAWLNTVSAATSPARPLSIRQLQPFQAARHTANLCGSGGRSRAMPHPKADNSTARGGSLRTMPVAGDCASQRTAAPVPTVFSGKEQASAAARHLLRLARRGLLAGAAAIVEGALLFVPGGAFGRVDHAVVIGVDLIEPLAKPVIAIGF